jgi:hypothetical protein
MHLIVNRRQEKPKIKQKRWRKYYQILCLLDQPKTTYRITKELGLEVSKTSDIKQILDIMEDLYLIWRNSITKPNGLPKHYWVISLIGMKERDQYKKRKYRKELQK